MMYKKGLLNMEVIMKEDFAIGNAQGRKSIAIRDKNRKRIRQWMKENPGGTKIDCQRDLGLSYGAVTNHMKVILAGQAKDIQRR